MKTWLLKRKKEASPEGCDQAIEGLSTAEAKAKAKAKRLQESEKVDVLFCKEYELYFGPALRAVASMSKFKKFPLFIYLSAIEPACFTFTLS